MAEVPIFALQEAIRNLHGCESRHVEAHHVTERVNGRTVWTGDVQVFDLVGHPTATRAYAWSHYVDDRTERRQFVTVLHAGKIDGPIAAVRAVIVQEHRERQRGA